MISASDTDTIRYSESYVRPADWWKNECIEYSDAVRVNRAPSKTASIWEREFVERAERWEKESAGHSAPGDTYLYRDYIAIMGLGLIYPGVIVPLILSRIPNTGADWFFALETIAGKNFAAECETFEQAYDTWVNWAKTKGFATQ